MLDKAKPRRHTRSSPFRLDDRDPLAVKFFAIGNGSAQTLRKGFGQQVTMVAEEFLLHTLPRVPILEAHIPRLLLAAYHHNPAQTRPTAKRGTPAPRSELLPPSRVEFADGRPRFLSAADEAWPAIRPA